ncbi:MAG: helix-turn-helix domain-containing protein [Micromonosporaceae bacterium]
MTIGDTLARARQDAGLSVTQISQRTRIRETVIRGIENDDFSPCGGDFYARGHIRSIAKVVGIDPDPLIQEYDAAHGGVRQVSAAQVFEPATPIKMHERRPPNWSAAMALAVLAVIVYGVIHTLAGSHHVNATAHQKPVRTSAAAPTVTHTPSPSATPRQRSVVVQLAANEDCWVGLYTMSGIEKWQGIIPAGGSHSWSFTRQVSMKIGNPGGIVLTVNGHRINSLGSQAVTLDLKPGKSASGY